MPYVNIKVTGGNEAPSAEQKAELIRGVTELLSRVLNKTLRRPSSSLTKSIWTTGA